MKAVGFDNVGAGFEVPNVDIADPIRARDTQIFVAVFEMRAAKISRSGVIRLEHRAHGAVENEDALGQRVFQLLACRGVQYPYCTRSVTLFIKWPLI